MQPLKEKGVKITPTVKKEIIKIIDERIREAHVTKEDFSELKGIVKELAEAQKRTEQRLEGLAARVEELAEAQKRTEQRLEGLAARVEELAEAQKRTEQRLEGLTARVEELAGKVAVLAEGLEITRQELKLTRGELGGLSRTMGYAFENEAFRMLPDILKRKYHIEITEKLIREEIRGKEINIFGKAKRNGKEVFVVGESKLRLDERGERAENIFKELNDKVNAVRAEYGDVEIIMVLITHYATKGFLKMAEERDVIVVQSFEW